MSQRDAARSQTPRHDDARRPGAAEATLDAPARGRPLAEWPAAEAIEHVRVHGPGCVIDVRTGVEVEAEHVTGSRWIPLDRIEERVAEVRALPAPRLVLCRTGSRAGQACQRLTRLEVDGLVVVSGGIEAWRAAGGRVTTGRKRISLERQVRVAAGALVFSGVALGVLLHPGFLALAAFVGAGLVFAGLTDRCGMALVLARMPWNRVPDAACPTTPPASA